MGQEIRIFSFSTIHILLYNSSCNSRGYCYYSNFVDKKTKTLRLETRSEFKPKQTKFSSHGFNHYTIIHQYRSYNTGVMETMFS